MSNINSQTTKKNDHIRYKPPNHPNSNVNYKYIPTKTNFNEKKSQSTTLEQNNKQKNNKEIFRNRWDMKNILAGSNMDNFYENLVEKWNINLSNNNINFGITVEASDMIYFYGQFTGNMNFGSSELVSGVSGIESSFSCSAYNSLSSSTSGMFLCKYDYSGCLISVVKLLDFDGAMQNQPYAQLTVESVYVYASLRISGKVILNNGNMLDSCNGRDILFGLDVNGNVTWTVQLKNVVNETLNIKTENQGNLYVVGSFRNKLIKYNAGNSKNEDLILARTSMVCNMFMLKINSSGNILWTVCSDDNIGKCVLTNDGLIRSLPNNFGFDSNCVDAQSVCVTSGGDPVVIGSYTNYVTFDNESLINPNSRSNLYVALFNSEGCFISLIGPQHAPPTLTTQQLSGYDASEDFILGESIDIDNSNNIYITGTIRGRYIFDDILQPDIRQLSDQNIFVSKLKLLSPGDHTLSFLTKNPINSFGKKKYSNNYTFNLFRFEWSRLIISTLPEDNAFYPNISVSESCIIYIAGQATGTTSLPDSENVQDILNIPGRLYLFVASITSDGIWKDLKSQIGTLNNSSEHISTIFSGTNDNVVSSGTFIVNQTQTNPFIVLYT